ncbi:MAG: hypothetical protein M3N47_03615 [Chloroflexota bacterium]|nr:hypothetical protein [Chloroflexota bacterium]
MESSAENSEMMKSLEPFIGEWALPAGGRTVFEWLSGGRFLVQRWEVPLAEVPDGIAIIGFDLARETYLQHYFDSRGIARVYEMSFSDGVWELRRKSADFSPLDFSQRFRGRFSDDGESIAGRWESSSDGASWNHDFDLTYTKVK